MPTFKAKLVVQVIAVEMDDAGEIVNEHVVATEPVYSPVGLNCEALVRRKMAELSPPPQGASHEPGT